VKAVGIVYVPDPASLAHLPEGSLRDRAVIVRLRGGGPESARGGARLDARARAAADEALARARHAGAAAVLFALDEGVSRQDIAAMARTAETPGRVLGGMEAARTATFFLHHQGALRFFRMAGMDGAEQLRADRADRPVPLPGVTVRVAAPVVALDQAEPPNVVGVLPGSDPLLRDTYVVLTAHMDHVGIGPPDASGDSIYNGADDNASGTAALMAIAAAFASLPQPPARSVLFLAVSGEEKGLLGSRWFADHPTVPIDAMVANLNMDMIGRNAPDSIVVIGQEYSSLGPLVRRVARANPRLGLTVSSDPWPEQRFFFRSDHFSFAAKEIPAIFFFAGTHADYHRPSDTVEKIDADKVARVARLAFLVALDVAQRHDPPAWDPDGLAEVRAMTRR
jgi:Zn-dependent M28 family amino/carboxypeptidase